MSEQKTETKTKSKARLHRRLRMEDLPKDENGKAILPDDITSPEFIRLTHPEMTDEEIARAIRKENKNVAILRAQIISLVFFVALVIFFIATR